MHRNTRAQWEKRTLRHYCTVFVPLRARAATFSFSGIHHCAKIAKCAWEFDDFDQDCCWPLCFWRYIHIGRVSFEIPHGPKKSYIFTIERKLAILPTTREFCSLNLLSIASEILNIQGKFFPEHAVFLLRVSWSFWRYTDDHCHLATWSVYFYKGACD